MGGVFIAEASIVAPMPGVLGNESSSSKGEDGGADDASLSGGAEVGSAGHRRSMRVPVVEVSEDASKGHSLTTQAQNMVPSGMARHSEETAGEDACQGVLVLSKWPFVFF